MDILIILIQLIARAFKSPSTGAPETRNPQDLAGQIQARIEAARVQTQQAANPTAKKPGARPTPARAIAKRPIPRQAPAPAQRKMKRKAPPPIPTRAAPQTVRNVVAKIAAAPTPPPRPAAVFVDAKVLVRWLRPQTLRSQFILTEIFQPPIALRDNHLS
jgi:hypothetical protein